MVNSYELLIEKNIIKEDIEEILFELGFENDNVKDRYYYFNENLSIRGCWFSVRFDYTRVHSITCVSTTLENRSFHDVEMQISVLRKIHEKYGGIITESKTGKPILLKNNVPQLSEIELATKRTFLYFRDNIKRVEMLIEEVDEKSFDIENRTRIQITNPSIIRHNTLVPFCVSILEDFLRTIFKQYLIHNEDKMHLYFDDRKGEMSYSSVKALFTGEVKLVDKIMDEYSFQNFKSTNKAFQKYMNINLFEVMKIEIPYLRGKIKIITVLQELIDTRHKIIHEAALHGKLGTKAMGKYCYFLERFGYEFVRVFEKKNGLNLFRDNIKHKRTGIKVNP
ncbi:hypothetical protein M4D55_04505 [Metabacillus idriensis]|uniref:hypothetical protein n=1 Tax=Metabacillus idriensis TaxID=324768 RepID=UPI00203B9FAC|nr:hypothetical protein [Metabacillus idriensis]MCM3595044.1 hypothetical protein [Metabacillus idriensis]